ncbi:MAG: carboxypeptidase-like regulatory domain-containing protein [Planctomycetia bacterium]|nr:carboxypeptidase-like regulatory domain-containing protein [Planctomycetia bacterium]
MKKMVIVLCTVILLAAMGCGKGYVPLSGKVTFPDGKPLTKGTVTFSTDSFMARGPLNEQGQYVLGSMDLGDGLPPGEYVVRVDGATETKESKVKGPSGSPMMQPVSLIDEKFTTTCKVDSGTKTFDFEVPYPAK